MVVSTVSSLKDNANGSLRMFGLVLFGTVFGYTVAFVSRQSALVPATCHVDAKPTTGTNDHGWHSINVFVGNRAYFHEHQVDVSNPLQAHNVAWYSQSGQDALIVAMLKNKRSGFYLDLAANDAVVLSNTLALERFHDWNGLCMEANPRYWFDLARLRTCTVVGAAVGGTEQQLMTPVQFQLNNEVGGIVGADFDNKHVHTATTPMFTVPIHEVLERYNVPKVIDYMSLDVEGAESYVMKDFPFDRYEIKIITGERLKKDLRDLLASKGYMFVSHLTDWGEGLYVNQKYQKELDMTKVPPNQNYIDPN